jgi:hypothetical protein
VRGRLKTGTALAKSYADFAAKVAATKSRWNGTGATYDYMAPEQKSVLVIKYVFFVRMAFFKARGHVNIFR